LPSARQRVLVTGALGCLGAWTIKALLDDGDDPVGLDLGGDRSRLELVLGPDRAGAVELVEADVTDLPALEGVLDEREITRVVHLAALQVPACRASPALGARVNVVGTVNVFEAVRSRLDRIPGLAYASSTAVYGPSDPSPAPESGGRAPGTLYGTWKLANEGTARVYWADARVASIGIRPYVVYGPGRDQGLTSAASLAMAAAARGEGFEIAFGGTVQYDYAPDVGRAFATAASAASERAVVANFPGVAASMDEVVAAIEAAAPGAAGLITWVDEPLPFPATLEAELLERAVGSLPRTSLTEGVGATVERFRAVTPAPVD
jgi:UDP-glucuronate 4-epimerase